MIRLLHATHKGQSLIMILAVRWADYMRQTWDNKLLAKMLRCSNQTACIIITDNMRGVNSVCSRGNPASKCGHVVRLTRCWILDVHHFYLFQNNGTSYRLCWIPWIRIMIIIRCGSNTTANKSLLPYSGRDRMVQPCQKLCQIMRIFSPCMNEK